MIDQDHYPFLLLAFGFHMALNVFNEQVFNDIPSCSDSEL